MAQGNREVVDFLIQIAQDAAKVEDFKINPNKVLSTFDFSDDIKSDIVSCKLENIHRHIKRKHPPTPPAFSLDPDY